MGRHHEKRRHQEERKVLYGRNSLVYNFCYLVATGVQLVVLLLLPEDHKIATIHKPKAYEQKFADFVALALARLPKLSFISLFLPWTSVLTLSFLVANTFDMMYCASGSALSSMLVALMLVFDEATVSAVRNNPALAVQMSLISISLGCAHKLTFYSLFSVTWFLEMIVGVGSIIFASYIRMEALPLAIPYLAQAALSFTSYVGNGSCFRLIPAFFASLVMFITLGVCAMIVCGVAIVFDLPQYEVWTNDASIFVVEFLTNPHNVAILGLIPLALLFISYSSVSGYWLLALVAGTAGIFVSPITCVVDDLLVKTVFGTYGVLVTCGFILSDEAISNTTAIPLAILLSVVVYFYLYPIQV